MMGAAPKLSCQFFFASILCVCFFVVFFVPDVETAVVTGKTKDGLGTTTDTYDVKDGCYRLAVSLPLSWEVVVVVVVVVCTVA